MRYLILVVAALSVFPIGVTYGARQTVNNVISSANLSIDQRIKLKPKYQVVKPAKAAMHSGLNRQRVIVKFVDGARVRETDQTDLNRASPDTQVLHRRLDVLAPQLSKLDNYDRHLLQRGQMSEDQLADQMKKFRAALKEKALERWGRLFGLEGSTLDQFRKNAEKQFGRQSSDLGNFFWFQLKKGAKGEKLVDRLNKLKIVEQAYLAPIPKTPDIPPTTRSFQGFQTYLNPAPNGIDAQFAWTQPGGDGEGIKVIDIEAGWNLTHEDLPSMFIVDGRNDTDESRQHGTAVMGVMLGLQDGAGITGIVPKASGGVVSVKRKLGIAYYDNVAEAVLLAAMKLSAGDVILIEQHANGPGQNNLCTCNAQPGDQCGYIAMEYWDHIFDALNAASASGVIVVEAAGNGEMDLDAERYKNKFNRAFRDSGALMVGAAQSSQRSRKCFSNFGSRLDVHGWGENVMTTGYGESNNAVSSAFRINGNGDDNQWYTNSFGGTSSATPMVAGAVIAIQGVQLARNNEPLDWFHMRDLLKRTGTPQSGSDHIGPLPNLQTAIGQLEESAPTDVVYEYTVGMSSTVQASNKVAGLQGTSTKTLGSTTDMTAIERLRFGERGDKPCFVQVEKGHITNKTIAKPHSSMDLCGSKGPTDRSLKYVPLLTTSHDTFLTGVTVCNSKSNKNPSRLKGVKFFQATVKSDGKLAYISNPKSLERPNCNDNWRAKAECPVDTVATQLIVHTRDEKKDTIVSGLELLCRAVTVTKNCVSGCPGSGARRATN